MAKRAIYRDKKTGHFVSFKTWSRSSSGRYVRKYIEVEEPSEEEQKKPVPDEDIVDDLDTWEELFEEAEEHDVEEYAGAFDTGKAKKK